MSDNKQPGSKPKNLREGVLNLAIWKNTTEKGHSYSSKLTRNYRDNEGQWQETPHLREKDQLPASNLFTRAHDFIRKDKAQDKRAISQDQQQGPQGPSR